MEKKGKVFETCAVQDEVSSEKYFSTDLINVGHRQPIHNLDMPAKLFQRLNRLLISQLVGFLVRDKHKVPGDKCRALFHTVLLGSSLVSFTNLHDKTVLDAEDCVGCLVGVAFDVKCPFTVGKPRSVNKWRWVDPGLTLLDDHSLASQT